MLGEYKQTQPILYDILSNEILNDKVNHAYLFDVSSEYNYFPFIYGFIKSMLCPNKEMTNNGCNKCNLCKSIDDANFPDIVIIESINKVITKEQLINLQREFTTTSLYNKKRIYIIKYAENLHISAANSILKFLEEPENNIIAILLTKNINSVLPTILSRCQTLKLLENNNSAIEIKEKIGQVILDDSDLYQELVDSDDMIDNAINFISYYESHGLNTIAHLPKLWFECYTDVKKNILAYNLMLLFYKDVVNFKLNRNIEIYEDYKEILETIAKKNSLDVLYKKIYLINDAINKNAFNINLSLNLDNLLLQMEELK